MSNIHFNDFLKNRRKKFLRGTLYFISILLFIFLLQKIFESESPFIAKVSINSIILNDPDLLKKIDDLKNNRNLKGVLIDINSPGGTVVSSQELFSRFKDLGNKVPVVASMKEVAASGGYMVALAADKIFCYEGTITGSIGVIMQSVNIESMLNTLGIEPVIFKSGPLKASPNPLESLDSNQEKVINNIINNIHNQFIELVKENRNILVKNLNLISDGRIFTGLEARNINLIDEIGSERDAIDWIKNETKTEDSIKIINISEDSTVLRLLNFLPFKDFIVKNISFSNGLYAIWAPSL